MMSNSQASGSSSKNEKKGRDHDAKLSAYERYCRSFNQTPIPDVLAYAKSTETKERDDLNGHFEKHRNDPSVANSKAMWRAFYNFPSSVEFDYFTRNDVQEKAKPK